MIEVVLNEISFGIVPMKGNDGLTGKQINFHHKESDTFYRVPLSQEAAEILAEHLTMTNEELEAKLEQNRLEAEVE